MKQNMRTHKLVKGLHLLVIAALLAGLALAVAPVPVAHAATARTITVSNAADGASGGTSCTLRDAISAANTGATGTFNGCTISSSGSGTPITYVLNLPSYTYILIGAAAEDGNTSGDLDILASITINGAGQDTTIIDGNQIDRVLHITSTTTVEINAVTIRNGKTLDGTDGSDTSDGGDSDHGGGIYNNGTLNIANSTLSDSKTGKGGDGGYSGGNGGDGGSGGSIYNKGALNIANSTLSGNSTGKGGDGGSGSGGGKGGDGGSGGGIYNDGGTVDLANSTLSGNSTGSGGDGGGGDSGGDGGSGGGIYNDGGAVDLTNSTVSSNETGDGGLGGGNGGNGGSGGGIYNSGTLILTNSAVSSNTTGNGGNGTTYYDSGGDGGNGGSGGGVYNSGTLTLTNSTVSSNRTGNGGNGGNGDYGGDGGNGGSGGGIHNSGVTVELINSTVSGNITGDGGSGGTGNPAGSSGSGGDGGGVRTGAGTTNLKNTILAGNSTAGSGPDCSGTLTSQNYNLLGRDFGCTFTPAGQDLVGTWTNPIDPKLDALALNPPGNTETHALLAGSPAIDAIPPTNCTVSTDQRGVDRPQGDECDIGAYEVQRGTIIVEKQTDPEGATGTFTFSDTIKAPYTFGLADDGQQPFTNVVSGTYTITETNPAPAFDLTDITCTDDNSTGDEASRVATIRLEAGETVTCTFTNTERGDITIVKNVVPDDTSLWDFALDGPTPGTRTDLGDGQSHTFSGLVPGFYNLSETSQAGYATTVDCGAKGSDDDDDIFLDLDAGGHITCTFTNTQHATLVIEKQADADECSSTFTFEVPNLAPGTYPITEDDPAPGFDLAAITCDDGGSATPSTGDVGTRTATFELDPAETVKCTFTNARGGTIVIQKQTHPAGGTDFNFTLDHDQTETFTDLPAGAYTLTEDDPTVNPGGFDLTSLVCLEDDTPNSTTDLTNRQAAIHLDPAETITCTYINTQQVTLSLITAGSGDGTIVVEPTGSGRRGLMASSAGAGYGEGSGGVYGWGTVLTLRAVPGVKSYFVSWSGDCVGTAPTTQLTMDGDKTCTATFGYPIGGIVVPVDRLGLLAPWMGLVVLASLAALTVALVRRHKSA